MNKRQKDFFRYRIIQNIKFNSRTGNKKGYIKCWKGVSFDHFIVMSKICWKLINEGFEVYTEAEFEKGGRADVLAIKDGLAVIIEIMNSETEVMLNKKRDYYPSECKIIPVKTKNFNINEFKI